MLFLNTEGGKGVFRFAMSTRRTPSTFGFIWTPKQAGERPLPVALCLKSLLLGRRVGGVCIPLLQQAV